MRLNEKDEELIAMANKVALSNCDLYDDITMHLGCAVRCKSGKVYTGINIKTSHSICAEQVAIGSALTAGEREFECIVSVKMNEDGETRVVSPCGLCRYTFEKMGINCDVIVEDVDGNVKKVRAKELLPYPYKR